MQPQKIEQNSTKNPNIKSKNKIGRIRKLKRERQKHMIGRERRNTSDFETTQE